MLENIRKHYQLLSRINLGLFALVWVSVVASSCVMAMDAGDTASHHDCPHCPPAPCMEIQPADCEQSDSLETPLNGDQLQKIAFAAPISDIPVNTQRPAPLRYYSVSPPPRAGPRTHLIHAQFNE